MWAPVDGSRWLPVISYAKRDQASGLVSRNRYDKMACRGPRLRADGDFSMFRGRQGYQHRGLSKLVGPVQDELVRVPLKEGWVPQ